MRKTDPFFLSVVVFAKQQFLASASECDTPEPWKEGLSSEGFDRKLSSSEGLDPTPPISPPGGGPPQPTVPAESNVEFAYSNPQVLVPSPSSWANPFADEVPPGEGCRLRQSIFVEVVLYAVFCNGGDGLALCIAPGGGEFASKTRGSNEGLFHSGAFCFWVIVRISAFVNCFGSGSPLRCNLVLLFRLTHLAGRR